MEQGQGSGVPHMAAPQVEPAPPAEPPVCRFFYGSILTQYLRSYEINEEDADFHLVMADRLVGPTYEGPLDDDVLKLEYMVHEEEENNNDEGEESVTKRNSEEGNTEFSPFEYEADASNH
ncbi:hypothetical protein HAX54_022435 [Datura stramonium]|uniref:Uncharacterized protein n=1 Tax=Datura stramonium TaxID=4076 RepID=A0ABS8UWB8_DATST|nr:hypothetical protein [Datura stramonium]